MYCVLDIYLLLCCVFDEGFYGFAVIFISNIAILFNPNLAARIIKMTPQGVVLSTVGYDAGNGVRLDIDKETTYGVIIIVLITAKIESEVFVFFTHDLGIAFFQE